MTNAAYFHHDSGAVRFWVELDGQTMGASVGRRVLQHRFHAGEPAFDPLESYLAHAPEIDAAVRRRVAQGSIEPVMLREFDLRPVAG